MTFQRIIIGLLVLVIAGLGGCLLHELENGDPVADDEGVR